MKGSSVVQGLKSLASRLHPQLPLSPKESQRLLTALTSSFRQHLDEAHPHRASNDDARPKARSGVSVRTGTGGLHSSSIALADTHLASVLTSPLLSKQSGRPKEPVLDYATAKVFLQSNPAHDPVTLLEEYHEQGTATIPIAILCLQSFRQSLEALPQAARKRDVADVQAGRRALRWLWDTKLFESDEFIDNKRLMELIVLCMVDEGHEESVWDWLKMDLTLGDESRRFPDNPRISDIIHRSRWRGYLLRSILVAKLELSPNRNIRFALEAFHRACDWKREVMQSGQNITIPMAAAKTYLMQTLKHYPECLSRSDAHLYDQLIDNVELVTTAPLHSELERSTLRLRHPVNPTPMPALQLLKKVFGSEEDTYMLKLFEDPRNQSTKQNFYMYMIFAAAQLQGRGLSADADWIVSQVERIYPDLSRFNEENLVLYRATPERAVQIERVRSEREPIGRLPLPSFV